MQESLHFSIDGKFITDLARSKFYETHQLASAIKLLWNCTINDDMTDTEHLALCLEIISGAKSIVGTYPGDDYDIIDTPESNLTMNDFIAEIDAMQTTIDKQTSDYEDLLNKYLFICDQLSDSKLKEIDWKYKIEYGKHLFDTSENPPTDNNDLVNDYISHMKNNKDDDYGWLEPDGTYHPVPWGEHSQWAMDYANEHYPFKDNAKMYWVTDANGQRHHYVCGDFLVYVLGWVLLDNPYQGIATPKYDESRRLTKQQKEFLYDYYIDRNLHDRANKIYQDDM